LIHDPSKLSVASYFNNMKSAENIHLVYLLHRSPNFTHFMINYVSDCGETYFPAVHHNEDTSIEKENIHANANFLLELQ
jgi:hypothetical protein